MINAALQSNHKSEICPCRGVIGGSGIRIHLRRRIQLQLKRFKPAGALLGLGGGNKDLIALLSQHELDKRSDFNCNNLAFHVLASSNYSS